MLLDDTESHGGLGGGARLGNHDAGSVADFGEVHKLGEIFFRQVVACEHHAGFGRIVYELVVQGLKSAARAEVRPAYTDDYHEVDTLLLPVVTHGLEAADELFGGAVGEILPAQEIIACAGFLVEDVIGGERLLYILCVIGFLNEGFAAVQINLDHGNYFFLYSLSPRSSLTRRGSLLVMASMPASIIALMSDSLFTVQALVDMPQEWAFSIQSGWALNIL